MIEVYCQLNGKEYIKINNDQIEEYANENDALYIANPNGLSGDAISIKHLTSKFKYVFADEVYADFYNEHSLLNDWSDNVIVIKSLSKSLGLAGLRVGFAVASEELTKE
jgi:histidinol-phosphate aminotransferase